MQQGRRPPNFKSMLEAALRGDLGAVPAARAQRGTPRSMRSTVSGYSDLGASASVVPDNYLVSVPVQVEASRQQTRVLTPDPTLLQLSERTCDASTVMGHTADIASHFVADGQYAGVEPAAAGAAAGANILQVPQDAEYAAAITRETSTIDHIQDDRNADTLPRSQLTGILFSDDEEES